MRKQLLQWLFGCCLFVVSQIAQSVDASSEQISRKRATSVTDTTKWAAHAHHTFGWTWLTDRKVLFARYNDDGTDTYFIRNVMTKKETKLTRLTKVMRSLRVCNMPCPSPNGKWMLIDRGIAGDKMELIALDGSRHFPLFHRNAIPVWLPDSRHFLIPEEEYNPRNHTYFLYDIDYPHISKKIAHPRISPYDLRGGVCKGSYLLTIDERIDDGGSKVTIHQRALQQKAHSDDVTVVRMPEGAKLEYASLSPRATQVFYVLNVNRTVAHRLLLPQPASFGATKPQAFLEIWISDIRGCNLRRLISLPKDPDDEEWLHFPLTVEWLPSGKAMGVEYHRMLYAIPIQEEKRRK